MRTEPPATARTLPSLDRRTLLRAGALGTALGAFPGALAAQLGSGFTSGVASGEPGADSVLLWTRYKAADDVTLKWEVSDNAAFTRPLAGGETVASPEHDGCAKARVSGLAPGQWYYYRFVAPDGSASEIGRTRTLPQGPVANWRMAVFSCSNLGFGYFNAYAHAAENDEFDLALHLGDYYYEYNVGKYPSDAERIAGRDIWPAGEAVHLADYRLRHASYRADPDLRRLTQLYPMLLIPDDHETANDSWEGGAENHQPETEGDWSVRKAAAVRAYREWLPVSDDNWAQYEIGDLATVFRLETRLTARSQQFDFGKILAGKTTPDAMMAALASFRDGAWRDPARTMIGADQQAWLAAGFKASRAAGKPWQVLAQQVLMGSLSTPVALAEQLGGDVPDYIRQRIVAGALASRAGLPLNMDSWDGYPAARERVLRAAQEADANLVVLAGDSHNAWAFDLPAGGKPAGVEFGGQSVTSPGYESFLSQVAPDTMAKALVAQNPQLKWADTARRGYMAVELTPERASCEWRFVGNVRQRSAALAGSHRASSVAGANQLEA